MPSNRLIVLPCMHVGECYIQFLGKNVMAYTLARSLKSTWVFQCGHLPPTHPHACAHAESLTNVMENVYGCISTRSLHLKPSKFSLRFINKTHAQTSYIITSVGLSSTELYSYCIQLGTYTYFKLALTNLHLDSLLVFHLLLPLLH